jgi:hypothetical protein
MRLWRPVDFLIDTGASVSLLNPTQAIVQIGFTREQLARRQPWRREIVSGIGSNMEEYILDTSFCWFLATGPSE